MALDSYDHKSIRIIWRCSFVALCFGFLFFLSLLLFHFRLYPVVASVLSTCVIAYGMLSFYIGVFTIFVRDELDTRTRLIGYSNAVLTAIAWFYIAFWF